MPSRVLSPIDALGTQEGTEYLVKIDKKNLAEYHTISKKIQNNGTQTVEQSMVNTDMSTRTDIVSAVQSPDASIHVGSRVYIIYSDDRPRIVSQNLEPQPAGKTN